MLPVNDWLSVRGLGLRLPGVTSPEDLARLVDGEATAPPDVRRFEAPYTDLGPVDRRAYGPVEPRMPPGVAVRGLRALPLESRLALATALSAEAVRPPVPAGVSAPGGSTPAMVSAPGGPAVEPDPGPVAVLWASSTAGLTEYATICVEAAVLEPGLSSPIIGPASAFNGPAASVSIRLGLDGPNETVTGGTTAGLTALIEAGRFVAAGEATRALVGGSATVSRWSLAGLADDLVPAEGAGCLAVRPWRAGDSGVRLGRFRRVGLNRSQLSTESADLLREALSTGGATGAPGPTVVSALDVDLVRTLAEEHPRRVWHLERSLGDFGAAGGLLAVAGAVAYCVSAPVPTSLLALAIEPSGNAAIMEVSTCRA